MTINIYVCRHRVVFVAASPSPAFAQHTCDTPSYCRLLRALYESRRHFLIIHSQHNTLMVAKLSAADRLRSAQQNCVKHHTKIAAGIFISVS